MNVLLMNVLLKFKQQVRVFRTVPKVWIDERLLLFSCCLLMNNHNWVCAQSVCVRNKLTWTDLINTKQLKYSQRCAM